MTMDATKLSEQSSDAERSQIVAALEKARAKLLDQTRRNRLINFKESPRDVPIVDELPDQVLEHLVERKKEFVFDPAPEEDSGEARVDSTEQIDRTLPSADSESSAWRHRDNRLQTPLSEKVLERRLRKLYSQHRTIIEETGANNLYLAIGFLHWMDGGAEQLPQRSPLILLPVRLRKETGAGSAVFKLFLDDQTLDTNYALLEKLRSTFDIGLPSLTEEHTPEAYWREVERAVSRKAAHGWSVVREMVLGLFRFQKQVMWHDLDPNRWPQDMLVRHEIVQRVVVGTSADQDPPGVIREEYDQEQLPTEDLPRLVLDADSSQLSAVIDALRTQSGLVIEGPPGTGKSQTIANLIAAALDKGRKVLFVAEKMAALRVVADRLERLGLGQFCLELHGLKTSKKELLSSLQRRMETTFPKPPRADVQRQELHATKADLLAVSKALRSRIGPDDAPLHRAIWRLEQLRQALPPAVEDLPSVPGASSLSPAEFRNVRNLLIDLGRGWAAIDPEARLAWKGFQPIRERRCDVGKLRDVLSEGIQSLQTTTSRLDGLGVGAPPCMLLTVSGLLDFDQSGLAEHLRECPLNADIAVLHRVIHEGLAQAFFEQVANLETFLQRVAETNKAFDYQSANADQYAESLRNGIEQILPIAPRSLELRSIRSEAVAASEAADSILNLAEIARPYAALTGRNLRTLDDYREAEREVRQLSTGPASLALHAHPFHAKSVCESFLESAEKEKEAIRSFADEYLSEFLTDTLPDAEELIRAVAAVREGQGRLFAFLRSRYRSARRLIRGLLRDGVKFKKSAAFLQDLDRLVEYAERRAAFAGNEDFRTALGSLFKGTATNWDDLREVMSHSRRLAVLLGLEEATRILQDWAAFSEEFDSTADRLQATLAIADEFIGRSNLSALLRQRPVEEVARQIEERASILQSVATSLEYAWLNTSLTLADAMEAVRAYDSARALEDKIPTHPYFDLVRDRWRGADSEITTLAETARWLRDCLRARRMADDALKWLVPSADLVRCDEVDELQSVARNFASLIERQLEDLSAMGKVDRSAWLLSDSLDGLSEAYKARERYLPSIPLMERWEILSGQATDRGHARIVDMIRSEILAGDQGGDACEFVVRRAVVEEVVARDDVLRSFSEARHEGSRDRFSALDRAVLEANAAMIAATAASEPVPQGNGRGVKRTWTQASLIRLEIGKQKKHIPIRQLVERAAEALLALKPCFLMSPLTVAQNIPPSRVKFDLVVMDEASQIRPEDALGAIARSSACIVVGDPKQLPPTSFFDTAVAASDDEEETVIEDTASILELCMQQFPYRRLRWHYRSRHESLIQFSNEEFYDGDLMVFPSPRGNSREYGVHFNSVEAPSYRKGVNRNEASQVVELITDHFRRYPDKTLGVVAMNLAQTEHISLLLDKARAENAELDQWLREHDDGEPVFVKNLENVQGDERDVIIISMTYGPEEAGGPVFQRFGPINSDLGWRRLNVVATRARERVEVVSSLHPTDVRIGGGARRGVDALRKYLEYAQTGRFIERVAESTGESENEFEASVGAIIESLGYRCKAQIGVSGFFIDIGVCHPDYPGEFLMGVECDGAAYHSSTAVRDRDRLRQEILESKGWHIHRIWSTSWFQSRAAEIEKLKRVLGYRLEADRRERPKAPEPPEPKPVEVDCVSVVEEDEQEEEAAKQSLEAALERYWESTIRPSFPDRENSILSDAMIQRLAAHRPTTEAEWFNAIPLDLRESMDPRQKKFSADIFEIVEEYE